MPDGAMLVWFVFAAASVIFVVWASITNAPTSCLRAALMYISQKLRGGFVKKTQPYPLIYLQYRHRLAGGRRI
jgi:hypothetical protein